MKATEQLMKEHSAIELMLKILEEACSRLETGKKVPIGDLQKMVEFLKVFADGCHHAKEEGHLFPAMEKAGIPRERGPIGVMLAEHDLGRRHIKRMAIALSDLSFGDTGAADEFVQHTRSYAHLLTLHIEKENKILFPMADAHLSSEVQASVTEAFDRFENEEMGEGKHEAFHKLLHDLSATYLDSPASPVSALGSMPVRAD